MTPGHTVGYVGDTGNCYANGHKVTSDDRLKGKGAHLHVSVFKLNENASYIHNIIDSNFYLLYFNKSNWKYTINPFDYDDENTWKGWEQ